MTDQFPPLAKFSARFGIIESADPVLPVTVRNLEAQIHAAQLDLQGGPANTGSRLSDLLSQRGGDLLARSARPTRVTF